MPKKKESESLCEYVITMGKLPKYWIVLFDRTSTSIACSCRKFETFGILCSHALKVIEANDVKAIPEKYILRRWTREARSGVVQDVRGKKVEEYPKLSRTRRYRQVVSNFIKGAAEESPCEEDLKIVEDCVDAMRKKIMERRSKAKDNGIHDNDNPTVSSNVSREPTIFKKKPSTKRASQKRHKSWIEQQSAPKKSAPPREQPCSQVSQVYHMVHGVSCSAPPVYEPPQTQGTQFSLTTYLMVIYSSF